MGDKNQNKWYYKILSLLKLETTTKHGRINLAGVIIITIFCLLYTAGDGLGYIVSQVSNVLKTWILQRDVNHKYESMEVTEAVIPIVVVFVLCLFFLMWHENRKKK